MCVRLSVYYIHIFNMFHPKYMANSEQLILNFLKSIKSVLNRQKRGGKEEEEKMTKRKKRRMKKEKKMKRNNNMK